MPMQCAYHPDREPVGACVECGRLICVECKALLGGRMYCTPCADKKFIHGQAAPSTPPPAAAHAAHTSAPPPARPADPPPAAAAPVYQTTAAAPASGSTNIYIQQAAPATQSESDQLRGWNWGAFMFSWIWGIFNRVWLSFLVFIPGLGTIWAFVLGAKGNEWAWKAKHWESMDAFKRHQKAWKPWAIVLFILGLLSAVGYAVFFIILIATVGLSNLDIGF
jgi:hypothetical protein